MTILRLPPQKKRYKEKTQAWREENMNVIDAGTSYHGNDYVRRSIREKYVNARLFDGVLTMSDVISTISSAGVLNAYVPKTIQHRPIIRPKIELLLGEASKEPFTWSVVVTDSSSISAKEEAKKKLINEKITALLQSQYSEEELGMKLKEMSLYFKYTWKDAKEVRATKILKYFEQKCKLEQKFNEAMLDKLVHGEELMMFDIIGKTVEAHKLDPKKVFTLYSGEENSIDNANIIIIQEYWSPGRVIDTYYDVLKPKQIDQINEGNVNLENYNRYDNVVSMSMDGLLMDNIINDVETGNKDFVTNRSLVDRFGNIRVLRALWRSQKLVKVVSGTDPETGEQYEKTMSEEYTANPLYGESIQTYWVGEWWEGAKVGADIYPRIRPRPVQFTSMGNLSKGHPGIVGKFNSVSGGKVMSFLAKMKPYQYLSDITWDRLLDAMKKDMGNIVEMDMAKKPAGWDTQKWLHYAYKGGILFVDSFKEATKGAAMGKIAGNFNTTGKTISTSKGDYIQQHINLLEYIKKELGDVGGITPQREGAVAPSASVGGTERSVLQSNNSTAYEFYTHEQFKLECMNILLETAKVALKGNKELAQVILDDFSIEMFNMEGDDFVDSDYSVFLTTSRKSQQLESAINQYSQAFMQNGGKLGTVLDIAFSDSISEKRRKVEVAEAEMEANAQQAAKAEADAFRLAAEKEDAAKAAELTLRYYEIDQKNATELQIALLTQEGADKKLAKDAEGKVLAAQVAREKIQSDAATARVKNKKAEQQ